MMPKGKMAWNLSSMKETLHLKDIRKRMQKTLHLKDIRKRMQKRCMSFFPAAMRKTEAAPGCAPLPRFG
ncbi:hypothetical protein HMSSN036_90050 [Paenibacillus macerans]|nr:hypothetical protein HMSSN036_90050 [Paenibacillus macerans]